MTGKLASLLIALALTAFSATDLRATPAEDMAAMLQQWLGKRETDLLATWGEPAQQIARGRIRMIGYFGEGSRPTLSTGGFTTIAGGRTGCSVTFEIGPRGVVTDVSWSTEGAADRDRARKACWREFRRNGVPE